jgi:hypothetical protein
LYLNGMKEDKALIDSDATSNFINHWTAERWQLRTKILDKPIQIFNIDRTENKLGWVAKFSTLRICYNIATQVFNKFYDYEAKEKECSSQRKGNECWGAAT